MVGKSNEDDACQSSSLSVITIHLNGDGENSDPIPIFTAGKEDEEPEIQEVVSAEAESNDPHFLSASTLKINQKKSRQMKRKSW